MFRMFNKIVVCFIIFIVLGFSACDYGLDYQYASNYCKDKYVFVDKQIEKIESSRIINKKFKMPTNELILEPLKTCYMAAFICHLQCYNLNPSCMNSLYETNLYCDQATSNLPEHL